MESIELGAVTVYPFGAALALAAAVCAVWSWRAAKEEKERRALEIFWILALPLGCALAHLGYALCSLDMIEDVFAEVLFDFAGGGYLLYGALAGAAVALAIACRVSKTRFVRAADLLAGPFLLFGAVCALAEGLVGCGYGWKVDDWFVAENSMSLLAGEEPGPLAEFFSRFPFAVKDAFYGYTSWAVFLPAAAGMLLGLIGVRRAAGRKEGSRAVLALSWYAAVRILYESLRQDDIPKWGFVRVNQILGAVLLLLLLILCYLQVRKGLGVSLGLLLGGVVVAGAMEFALEKKIGFLEWMTMDLCYLCSAAGCWMMFHSVDRMRKMRDGAGGKR